MQMPSTPWSIMQSSTRRCPWRSSAPSAVKGVGATGTMPDSGFDEVGCVTNFSGKAASVIVARHRCTAAAHEKIEVDSVVRLQHMVDIEFHVAALAVRRRWIPRSAPARELGVVDVEVKLAGGNVERDEIAIAHQREGTSCGRLGRRMQHDRPVRGA